ncbi:MAG TPA: hypothetical protein ENK11_09725 [Phycisphaerales bacterium]|nr:hypothetical protein [Phycisphaerales bacterium]
MIAVISVAFAGVMYIRGMSNNAPDSISRLSEMVTIRCTETGKEWQMNRGQFERLLMTQDGLIDPNKGIPSKFADGRPTGVLVDKKDWEETVKRINAMKKAYQN